MLDDFDDHYDRLISWCAAVLGPIDVISDHSKAHGEHESATIRLRRTSGVCYLKIHASRRHWHSEVYAYEQWARAFGDFAPRLLAVHEDDPPALVVSEVPGRIVENIQMDPVVQRAVWRAAGAALVTFHESQRGKRFGLCLRDGTYRDGSASSAVEFVSAKFGKQIARAKHMGYLSDEELATLRAVFDQIPAFDDESPIPCHRDYCAANWLVDERGCWAGIIDFEFAHWDVRVADFSRDPDWAWIRRPDLMDAFVDGYGRRFTDVENQQLLVARAEYALDAIVWGFENAFYGFEREGREALVHLAALLN